MPDKKIELTEMEKRVIDSLCDEQESADYGIRILSRKLFKEWYPEIDVDKVTFNRDKMVLQCAGVKEEEEEPPDTGNQCEGEDVGEEDKEVQQGKD
jgi:hypothetical protein